MRLKSEKNELNNPGHLHLEPFCSKLEWADRLKQTGSVTPNL